MWETQFPDEVCWRWRLRMAPWKRFEDRQNAQVTAMDGRRRLGSVLTITALVAVAWPARAFDLAIEFPAICCRT
jgi:hypothetical protein